jgi:hypothetical protein
MEIFGCVALAVVGAFQLWAGFDGAAHYVGPWWPVAIFVVCFAFRLTLPLAALGFLGAWVAWEWWWPWAALLMVPMLVISLPSLLADVVAWWWRVLLPKP